MRAPVDASWRKIEIVRGWDKITCVVRNAVGHSSGAMVEAAIAFVVNFMFAYLSVLYFGHPFPKTKPADCTHRPQGPLNVAIPNFSEHRPMGAFALFIARDLLSCQNACDGRASPFLIQAPKRGRISTSAVVCAVHC